MIVCPQLKEEEHGETYCSLFPFNFHLFKIQII